jgi:hypothetical protein
VEWYEKHGQNVTLTCGRFGISRSTFYWWRGRHDPLEPKTLKSRSSMPRRLLRPGRGLVEVEAVKLAREQHPS